MYTYMNSDSCSLTQNSKSCLNDILAIHKFSDNYNFQSTDLSSITMETKTTFSDAFIVQLS